MTIDTPKPVKIVVGVGVLVVDNNRVLLAKRLRGHGAGSFGALGGKLEAGESAYECATREMMEEAGVAPTAGHLTPLCASEFEMGGIHYIDLMFLASGINGNPRVLEPEKLGNWEWFSLEALPEPLFPSVALATSALKNNAWAFFPKQLASF